MQEKIENFLHDFYADIDSGEDIKHIMSEYLSSSAAVSHYGVIYKGEDGLIEWLDSIINGHVDSVHRIKSVEHAEFGDIIAVQADIVWTAGFKNMSGKNMVMHKTQVRLDLLNDYGTFKIKNLIAKSVG